MITLEKINAIILIKNRKQQDQNQKIKKGNVYFKVYLYSKKVYNKADPEYFGVLLETCSWVTGLHWRPKKQSSPEDLPGGEKKEIVEGQKIDQTRDGQRRRGTASEEQTDKERIFSGEEKRQQRYKNVCQRKKH